MTEIDVSNCAFYDNGKCSNPNGMACNCRNTAICYFKELKRLEQKNKAMDEEKNCLHLIIDRLLENSGYSKDIASAEDFEDVYEDMQRKGNELIELKQENRNLKEENAKLKEKIIKLTEENGNLIINRNTVENKLRDTESRLISMQKANTHNLVLLQRRNNTLEEIRGINNRFFDMNYGFDEQNISYDVKEVAREIQDKINEVLKDE